MKITHWCWIEILHPRFLERTNEFGKDPQDVGEAIKERVDEMSCALIPALRDAHRSKKKWSLREA